MEFRVRHVMAALVIMGAASISSLPAMSAPGESNASNVRTNSSPATIRFAEKKAPPKKAAPPKAPPPKKAAAPKAPPKAAAPKAPPKKTAAPKASPKKTVAPKAPPKTVTPKAPPKKTAPIVKKEPKAPTKAPPVVTKPTPKTPVAKAPPKAVQKSLTPMVKKRPPRTKPVVVSNTRNVTIINNRTVQVYRDRRRVYIGGVPRTLIAVSGLAALTVAGIAYYPQGYAVLARPVCQGITEAGCALQWQAVATDDGFTVPQCVQYCRQGYVPPPPPPRVVMAPPQLLTSGGCEVTIFSEPNFGGESSETTEAQANLEDSGWDDSITSVEVRMGIWDFFSEPEFSGEAIRLEPGSYPTLPQDWLNRINSFMCSEPTN